MPDKLEQGIADIIKKALDVKYLKREVVLELLRFLDSQGIVRKVDGAMPQLQSRLTERANMELMLKQGWVKTERLIDEPTDAEILDVQKVLDDAPVPQRGRKLWDTETGKVYKIKD